MKEEKKILENVILYYWLRFLRFDNVMNNMLRK